MDETTKAIDNGSISILLIDDEEKIVSRLARTLSKEGYHVEKTDNGGDAITLLDSRIYDIVVTDLNMPDITGFEIMDYIQQKGIETLPLVLTGYASVEGAIQAIKLGAYDFIEKPIDAPTLKLTIQRAAEHVLLKRENEKNLKELQKLNELKNEFLSVVSHDLRSPLSTIGGFINYLLKKGDLNDLQKRYLNIILDISENLYSLVNELLDISKIETGIIQLNKEPTNIPELIDLSLNNFILLAIDKNIRIEFHHTLSTETIIIDRMKILQVMNNLINNAIKFTENGTIKVLATEQDSVVTISVEDTGMGISPESIDNLFTTYSFLHKEGTRGESGSGLGLIICKRFIELHGGTISVVSRSGEGSRFVFTLPVETVPSVS